ncbi:hypothetical protein QK290_16000 [Pseudarthrobacter sp. AL07]|uniref:hypothetical protein n=1 Tax=unclassified Pseudarthrobacter TaxID=2647000 RepID=UPI00249CB9FE|nr:MULTISPECIES: hypothetical protein [unclassified Pseudarthrobacter]MDI3195894.1 hypothetical protein [Pseudarthrobacter sp. AL20]MDI3209966.1 hypothetical protein [Pseudarthrobacter sp. AL07]
MGLVASYREELLRMGAAAADIELVTDRDEGGGVSVMVTWINAAVADRPAPVEERFPRKVFVLAVAFTGRQVMGN